jgi:hypothetical protein
MSEYFVWDQIHVHVAEYDWYVPTADCCIAYTVHVQNNITGLQALAIVAHII